MKGCLLVVLLLARASVAQEVALARPAIVASAVPDEGRSRGFYTRAMTAAQRGEHRVAVILFQQAWQANPRPSLLYNIGMEQLALLNDGIGTLEEAQLGVNALSAFLRAVPNAMQRDEVVRSIESVVRRYHLKGADEAAFVVPPAPSPERLPALPARSTVPSLPVDAVDARHSNGNTGWPLFRSVGIGLVLAGAVIIAAGAGAFYGTAASIDDQAKLVHSQEAFDARLGTSRDLRVAGAVVTAAGGLVIGSGIVVALIPAPLMGRSQAPVAAGLPVGAVLSWSKTW